MMRVSVKFLLAGLAAMSLAACADDAKVASYNISKAADQFEIVRRIVFYNGITGEYVLTVQGLCSIDADNPRKLAVTCKTGPSEFKKHYLGLSDNVTWFAEHIEASKASTSRYRVIFKPSVILPDIDVR